MVVCGGVVVTVSVTETTLVGPLPDPDPLQVLSAGKPVQVRLTAVVKRVEATIPTVVVPEAPGAEIVMFPGVETTAKPGVIMKLTGAVLLLALKLASPR